MPNCCENTMTVSGDTAEVQRFIDQAKQTHGHYVTNYSVSGITKEYREDEPGFFWNFVSPPAEAQTVEDYFSNDRNAPHYWYNWNVSNWGTKWDTDFKEDELQVIVDEGQTSFGVSFDTAWAPAIQAYEAMAEQYPNLYISVEYSETGMCFWGSVTYAGGELVDEEQGEIDHDWLVEKYNDCPEVVYGNLGEGEVCDECGAGTA